MSLLDHFLKHPGNLPKESSDSRASRLLPPVVPPSGSTGCFYVLHPPLLDLKSFREQVDSRLANSRVTLLTRYTRTTLSAGYLSAVDFCFLDFFLSTFPCLVFFAPRFVFLWAPSNLVFLGVDRLGSTVSSLLFFLQ